MSASPTPSLAVTLSSFRSMPRSALEKIELERMRLPVLVVPRKGPGPVLERGYAGCWMRTSEKTPTRDFGE